MSAHTSGDCGGPRGRIGIRDGREIVIAACRICAEQADAKEMRELINRLGHDAPEVTELRKAHFRAGVARDAEHSERVRAAEAQAVLEAEAAMGRAAWAAESAARTRQIMKHLAAAHEERLEEKIAEFRASLPAEDRRPWAVQFPGSAKE